MKAYLKPLKRSGRVVEVNSLDDVYRILGTDSIDHLVLELDNISIIIWVPVTGNIGPSNLNFETRTHTYGSFSGMEAYGFPIYGDALIQKTDSETGESASLNESDILFLKNMIGEVDLNPSRNNPINRREPPYGARTLLCVHMAERARKGKTLGYVHFFTADPPIEMGRPDGSSLECGWIAICQKCFDRVGEDVLRAPIGGDGIWGRDFGTSHTGGDPGNN